MDKTIYLFFMFFLATNFELNACEESQKNTFFMIDKNKEESDFGDDFSSNFSEDDDFTPLVKEFGTAIWAGNVSDAISSIMDALCPQDMK